MSEVAIKRAAERSRPRTASVATLRWSILGGLLLFLLLLGLPAGGQAPGNVASRTPRSKIQEHYDAAFRDENAGNLTQANAEYKLYLAAVLHRVANGRANLGEYARASSYYDEALRLAAEDRELHVDYAGAARDASDWRKAKALAQSVEDSLTSKGLAPDPRAVSVLAHALLELGETKDALEQFQTMTRLRPGLDTSLDLATAYLDIGDKAAGTKILNELVEKFGSSADLHMKLGIAYGKAGFFDLAIGEFRKAIAMDPRMPGAHFSIGASYMMLSGEADYDEAEEEFRRELEIDPKNRAVYAPLGTIVLSKHRYAEAEADLKRATELNPLTAGTYIALGKLYKDTGKASEAEAAFQRAIRLTLDPSKNGFEIEQAYYWLGRLQMQRGKTAEARRNLDISRSLLYLREQQLESRLVGNMILQTPQEITHEADAKDVAAENSIEKEVGSPIASSYFNLGVNAAKAGDFGTASDYFDLAQRWNPKLEGVDKNLSRAALAAQKYRAAIAPLVRMLAQNPENGETRAMLGLSYCMTHDYARAVTVMQPIAASLEANPLLTAAFATSEAIAADSAQGLSRLKALEQESPNVPVVHYLLGEVYASKQQYDQAAGELGLASQLDASNADARIALADVDLALDRKPEAVQLLSELAKSGSKETEVYTRLAQTQMKLGATQDAIASLQEAIQLSPLDPSLHEELSAAYRKNAQTEEADKELRQAQTLQAQRDSSLKLRSTAGAFANGSEASGKF